MVGKVPTLMGLMVSWGTGSWDMGLPGLWVFYSGRQQPVQ